MTTIPLTVASLHDAPIRPLRIIPGPEIVLAPEHTRHCGRPEYRRRLLSDDTLRGHLESIPPGTERRLREVCRYNAASRARICELARSMSGYSVEYTNGRGGRSAWIKRT